MSDGDRRSPLATLSWLVSGIVLGGLAAGAIVLAGVGLLRGDAPTEAVGPPLFLNQTETSGVDHTYDGEFEYFVGGGVSIFDCNADLLPDMYLAGGENPASLYVNRSEVGGDLSFERASGETTDMTAVTGAYPLDIDSDGVTDLAILRVGENVMLRGLGDCRFERANEEWSVDGGDDWTAAFSAEWEPTGTLPTLAFGNYLALDALDDRDRCAPNYLFRPESDVYVAPIALEPGWCTLSILFSDWSRSGQRDLRMTNDRHYYTDGEEQLWRVPPGERPALFTETDGWQTMQIWGMGIASQDVTGDGLPEVFLTSQGDNKLQTLTAGPDRPEYEDIALAAGATAHRPFIGDTNRPSTAWHAEFDDVNNDGFNDLFVTKGNVEAQTEFAMDDPNNLLLGQSDGSFVESADEAGVLDYSRSRGGAVADLNLDGLVDIVVVERREPVKLWRNTGSPETGNWLAIEPTQSGSNRNAIGSWIEVRLGGETLQTEVTVGGGHAGGQLGPTHFGLGDAMTADVRIVWPDGVEGPWVSVDANQVVAIDRDLDTAATVFPLQD